MAEFSPRYAKAASRMGIDIEKSYLDFLLEIKVGGPTCRRVVAHLRDYDHFVQHNYGTTWGSQRRPSRGTPLTQAQLECVELLAKGFSYQKIADTKGRSIETVKTLLALARARANAKTSTHLVAIAIRNKWI